MRFDAIIFDFDGVIVDSEWAAATLLASQLTEFGLPTTADEALERYCGFRWSDCIAMIEDLWGEPLPEQFIDRLMNEGKADFRSAPPAIPGVRSFVESQDHRLCAIASSSEKDWLDQCIDRLGLADHFAGHVYSAEGVERGKPNPDVYLMVAKRLGVAPDRIVVIEDSVTGVAAGSAAGMTVAGLLAGGHVRDGHAAALREAGADHVVADYAALSRLIADIES